MECALAKRLRNIAIVSMSRELIIRTKRREAKTRDDSQNARSPQTLILLRESTDRNRIALQEHLTSCRQCRGLGKTDVPVPLDGNDMDS